MDTLLKVPGYTYMYDFYRKRSKKDSFWPRESPIENNKNIGIRIVTFLMVIYIYVTYVSNVYIYIENRRLACYKRITILNQSVSFVLNRYKTTSYIDQR